MTRDQVLEIAKSAMEYLLLSRDKVQKVIDALSNPKWISVKDDLPYKHKELLSSDHETKLVLTIDACGSINTDFMSIYEGTWCGWNDSNTVYWHPISDFDKNLL